MPTEKRKQKKTSAKTTKKAKDKNVPTKSPLKKRVPSFTFKDKAGKEVTITGKQKLWADVFIESSNGTYSALASYDLPNTELYDKSTADLDDEQKLKKKTLEWKAATIGKENRRNIKIIKYIDYVLDKYEFTDEKVKMEHFKIINQDMDYGDKAKGIDMYYKVKGKYAPEKIKNEYSEKVEEALDKISKMLP